MTRLIVHAGTHATDWVVIQRQLVAWRSALDWMGFRLHPEDDADAWTKALRDLSTGDVSEPLVDVAKAAIRDEAAALLLSSDVLEDPLRTPEAVDNLERFARDLDMPLTVLTVVRDQLGYLNELYCDRITHLSTARDFRGFVADPAPADRFDYAAAFQLLLASPTIDFVAIPYGELRDRSQGGALLAAAGLPAADVAALPPGRARSHLPGPMQIAATRLLFKRMARLGMFHTLARQRLVKAAGRLRVRSDEQGWDDGPFWGWDEAARHEAIVRYAPGNDILSMTVWDRPWVEGWEKGEYADVDLPACPPALVVDMLLTVDRIIRDLQSVKTAADRRTEAGD